MKFINYIFLLLTYTTVFSQTPSIEWEKSFGGSDSDIPSKMFLTSDNGYVIAGSSRSNDGDLTQNQGTHDYWVVKISSTGQLEWQKSLGGSQGETAYSIIQTNEGGYIVSGFTRSYTNDGDITVHYGGEDIWVVKLDSQGNIEWEKSYGGSSNEGGNDIIQTIDGGYIIAGSSSSDDGDVSNNKGGVDYWVVKITNTGMIEWEKNYGGSGNDSAERILQLNDGSYIIVGTTTSNDGDVSSNQGGNDFWIVKLQPDGLIEWEKTFGGSSSDVAKSINTTDDGGFIVAGYTRSSDGNISTNYGGTDYWVLKLSVSGNLQWEKSYGGTGEDYGEMVKQTQSGNYIISGYSGSNDIQVSNNHGSVDSWVMETNTSGSIIWAKCYGGSNWDSSSDFVFTNDNSIVFCGRTDSNDGDVSENNGNSDYWIVKLEPNILNISEFNSRSIIYPNPVSEILKISCKNPIKNVIIYNSLGQQMLQKAVNDFHIEINLSSLSEGSYVVKIIYSDFEEIQKFLINRQ